MFCIGTTWIKGGKYDKLTPQTKGMAINHLNPRSLQVPEAIHEQYMNGGRADKAKLLQMFIDSGLDKVRFGFQIYVAYNFY